MSATPAMTITELIAVLKCFREGYGNLPVFYYDSIGYDADKLDIRVTDVRFEDESEEELWSNSAMLKFPKRLVITGDTVWNNVSLVEVTNAD